MSSVEILSHEERKLVFACHWWWANLASIAWTDTEAGKDYYSSGENNDHSPSVSVGPFSYRGFAQQPTPVISSTFRKPFSSFLAWTCRLKWKAAERNEWLCIWTIRRPIDQNKPCFPCCIWVSRLISSTILVGSCTIRFLYVRRCRKSISRIVFCNQWEFVGSDSGRNRHHESQRVRRVFWN